MIYLIESNRILLRNCLPVHTMSYLKIGVRHRFYSYIIIVLLYYELFYYLVYRVFFESLFRVNCMFFFYVGWWCCKMNAHLLIVLTIYFSLGKSDTRVFVSCILFDYLTVIGRHLKYLQVVSTSITKTMYIHMTNTKNVKKKLSVFKVDSRGKH